MWTADECVSIIITITITITNRVTITITTDRHPPPSPRTPAVEKVRGSSAPRRPGTPLTPTCADLTRPLRRVATLEFDRTRKSMSVLAAGVRVGDIAPSGNALLAKGAPDTLLPRCSHVLTPTGSVEAMTDKHRRALAASVQGMAGDALRTLAFAAKFENLGDLASYDGTPAHPGHALVSDTGAYASIESGMVFLGVVGIMDPPRKEVRGGGGGGGVGVGMGWVCRGVVVVEGGVDGGGEEVGWGRWVSHPMSPIPPLSPHSLAPHTLRP